MPVTRKHRESDMFEVMKVCGQGNYVRGVKRIAEWIGVNEKHVRFWLDYQQRFPARWTEKIQQCCLHYGGKRVPVRFENDQRGKRKCLRCGEMFPSENVGNRICLDCKSSVDFKATQNGLEEMWILK